MLGGVEMGLKSRDPQKAHVGLLLNVNFSFLAQLKGVMEGQHFFEDKKGEIPIFPFLNDLRSSFFGMLYNF